MKVCVLEWTSANVAPANIIWPLESDSHVTVRVSRCF
jgi:hypothetical protein